MSINLANYSKRILKIRHFWWHLTLCDLRIKYRRSFLGMGWAVLQPLFLTLLLSFVMSQIFQSPLNDYAPYVFSGLIFWEYLVSSSVQGTNSLINAEGYIRQFSHPLAIYSLRTALANFINLSCSFFGLFVWILLWKPENINMSWLTLPLSFALLLICGWTMATITAFVTVRFRDFSQMITLILQALWYVSPVFFLPSHFAHPKIKWILDFNPIYHLLSLFRSPLLNGSFPSLTNYVFILGLILFLSILSILFIKSSERKVIFYL